MTSKPGPQAIPTELIGDASFSRCKRYRYTLTRTWHAPKATRGRVCFCMLNPSTADENVFDPTVRRCFGYALTWGFSSMEVVNIFALRSTDPKALYAEPDPIGPRNDREILAAAKRAELVVAAWGTHGKHLDRGNTVANLLHTTNNTPPLVALKVTAAGHPGHPLYLPASIEPKPYKPITPQR